MPAPGFLLVKPEEVRTKTDSGLILQQEGIEKPHQGVVLECGSEENCPAKKGQIVIYKKWGSNDVKVGDVEYQFIKFEDILGTIE